MSDEQPLNLKAGAFGLTFLIICILSMLSMLFKVPPLIAFSIVLVAFTIFVTTALVSAKTTGGFYG